MGITYTNRMFALGYSSVDKKADIAVSTVSLPPTPPAENADESTIWTSDGPTSSERQAEMQSTLPESVVAVIGVGYVGTHLVEAFAGHYKVIAFDLSQERLDKVSKHLRGLPIHFTSTAKDISDASHVLISVPTILREDRSIDTSFLRSALATVESHVRPGSTVVIESSVAVGMTRELVGPLMASRNLKVGMSPERVDPGRTFPAFEDIPKIVSGLDNASLKSIYNLYDRVFDKLLAVSSPEVAEMTKLYENCQRMICAAYANEMADACAKIGINAFEVSTAAASKPFGYLPFRPGPGVGGHCIPVNPYYLLSNCSMPLLEQATKMSWQRPANIAERFVQSLVQDMSFPQHPDVDTSLLRFLVVGVGFKRGQDVLSNSPGAAIIAALRRRYSCYVEFADPLVGSDIYNAVPKMDTTKDWNIDYLRDFDGIIVAVDQEGLDMDMLADLNGVKVQDFTGTIVMKPDHSVGEQSQLLKSC